MIVVTERLDQRSKRTERSGGERPPSLNVGCQAMGNCSYNDNLCVMTQENSCGNPMMSLAQKLGCSNPANCNNVFNGVYQYMGQKWVSGAACGVEGNSWCSVGTSYSNRWALCVQ
jgi:hypothetical protein